MADYDLWNIETCFNVQKLKSVVVFLKIDNYINLVVLHSLFDL